MLLQLLLLLLRPLYCAKQHSLFHTSHHISNAMPLLLTYYYHHFAHTEEVGIQKSFSGHSARNGGSRNSA